MNQLRWMLLLSLTVVASVGCESKVNPPPTPAAHTDDHDHEHGDGHDHAHPETLAAGVAELTDLRNTVRDAFAKNDIDTAHGPLHDVGHLLDDISALVEKEQLAPETLAAVKASIETLYEAFGDVDKTLHGQEGSSYSEVSDKIDSAIQTLADAAAGTASPAADDVPAQSAPEQSVPEVDADAATADPVPDATTSDSPSDDNSTTEDSTAKDDAGTN